VTILEIGMEFEVVEKKKGEETSDKWGKKPVEREIPELLQFGVVNLDKPPGPTSHQTADMVKRVLGVKKAGHSGTLDPGVTGVIPIGLNHGTKVMQTLLGSGKEYICLMHIHKDLGIDRIRKVLKEFTGKIEQLPPVKSSVKRVLRERSIYETEILDYDEKDILFRVSCEKGTYIRKLVHDMGENLGCGAHMQELRRTRVASFTEHTNMVSLHELSEAMYLYNNDKNEKYLRYCVQPLENAVPHLKKMWVIDSAVGSVTYGAKLKVPGIVKLHKGINKEELICLMTLKDELIALAKAEMSSDEIMENKRGIAASLQRVIMERDVYPRMWNHG